MPKLLLRIQNYENQRSFANEMAMLAGVRAGRNSNYMIRRFAERKSDCPEGPGGAPRRYLPNGAAPYIVG
jgi:hypothetical protein